MQGRRNILTCRECGKRKRGNYFISETLCKKCAAKRRRPRPRKPNPILELEVGLHVTSNVEERLRGEATAQVPRTSSDRIAPFVLFLSYATFWVIGWHYSIGSVVIEYLESLQQGWSTFLGLVMLLVFPLFWYVFLPLLTVWPIVNPIWEERERKVKSQTIELATERQERIDEANQFYASAEWRSLRNEIVAENRNVCQSCGKKIRKKVDITVDHVLPRSKYPQLSLEKSNLQIMCRKCNSSKGNYVPFQATVEDKPIGQ